MVAHGAELDVDDVWEAREVVLDLPAAAGVEEEPVHQVDGPGARARVRVWMYINEFMGGVE
jgi:hypothetical protein